MKLGPAIKLRTAVSRLTGDSVLPGQPVCLHCPHCHARMQNVVAKAAAEAEAAAASAASNDDKNAASKAE